MIVSDIDTPFCPVPVESLFLNISLERNIIELVTEKINIYANYLKELHKSKKLVGSVSGSAIYVAYNCLKDKDDKGKGNCERQETRPCHHCLTPGHLIAECRSKAAGKPKAPRPVGAASIELEEWQKYCRSLTEGCRRHGRRGQ